jgi:hypothetical protein
MASPRESLRREVIAIYKGTTADLMVAEQIEEYRLIFGIIQSF